MVKRISAFWIVAIVFSFFITAAFAAPLHLGSKGQLNAKACDKEGKAVINVNEKVKNDVDSGFGGNNWAFDNYSKPKTN